MMQIFYKSEGHILSTPKIEDLDNLPVEAVIWIDLFAPDEEETRCAEKFLGTTIQSRAMAEEIESSSRYSETETAIYANTNFLIPGPDEYAMEAVSFILTDGVLATLREVSLRSFTDIQRRMMALPRMYPSGYHIFVAILENRIDLDADMIELMSKEIAQYSKHISLGEHVSEEFLLDINQLQENTMMVRENIVDKQRVISSVLKSDKYPPEIHEKLSVLIKDIASLINHTNFSFERLEYLQNTLLGLINLEQNRIMKVFTQVSLLLMPPTLVASIYGMNVHLPVTGTDWDFLILVGVMMLVVAFAIVIFKKRKMM